MAFAITAAERGQDDALEQFDRVHRELLLRVNAQSKRERLADRRGTRRGRPHADGRLPRAA
jgi:hypothetical protein